MNEQKYQIKSPVGTIVTPKENLTEAELRKFFIQITHDEVWREKIEKDPIESVVELMGMSGYEITKI